MTYQVLARKYRPQTFAEVVGQEHITTTLKNAIASGRVHHAYLFTGARGIGKTTVARILAKALNCQKRRGEEPCGKCSPCIEITNGSSLDIQEIDGASNTSVDDVREIRERVRYMPASAKYKIYIIDEVHMLSTSAFNALLKTLEEPPSHVIFIFATTEAHKIPATILSRCQRYDFRRIPRALITKTLENIAKDEGIAIDSGSLHVIAHEATGSLRDAESLLDQAIAFSGEKVEASKVKEMLGTLDRGRLFGLLSAVFARDASGALGVLDEAFQNGGDLVRLSMDVLEMLRHLLVMAECGAEGSAVDLMPEEISTLKKFLKDADAPRLHRMFTVWYEIADGIGRSPFPKMLLEVGLMRLSRIGDVVRVDDVIARIDSLSEAMPPSMALPQSPVPPARAAPAANPPRETKDFADKKEPSHLSFEPAGVSVDPAAEKKWQEFMRWVVVQKPQVASILQNGVFSGIEGDSIGLSFANPLYADMLSEEDRKAQVASLLESFFKRRMNMMIARSGGAATVEEKGQRKKDLMREALGSDVVRKAAEVLNATLHEVKIDGDET